MIDKYDKVYDHKLYFDDDLDTSDVDSRNFSSVILNIKVKQYGLFPMIYQNLYSSIEFQFYFKIYLL